MPTTSRRNREKQCARQKSFEKYLHKKLMKALDERIEGKETPQTFVDTSVEIIHSFRPWERYKQQKHECYLDMYYLYHQMKYIGNLCQGRRQYRECGGGDVNLHYWLEVGKYAYTVGLVYWKNDDGIETERWGVMTYDKEKYHDHYQIKDYEVWSQRRGIMAVGSAIKSGLMIDGKILAIK